MAFFDAFGVDVFKLGFQIFNFLLLLYLLNRFLFKPVIAMLDERRERLAKGLEDAESAARDRELASAAREETLAEARREAQAIIARASKMAEDSRSETIAGAKAEADKVVAKAREEIETEKERAMSELRGHVADLALAAAGKLVRSEMDGGTQRRLVEEFLAEMPAEAPSTAEAKS